MRCNTQFLLNTLFILKSKFSFHFVLFACRFLSQKNYMTFTAFLGLGDVTRPPLRNYCDGKLFINFKTNYLDQLL